MAATTRREDTTQHLGEIAHDNTIHVPWLHLSCALLPSPVSVCGIIRVLAFFSRHSVLHVCFALTPVAAVAELFDPEQFTINGEIRERYEGRMNSSFGNPNRTAVDQNNHSFIGSRIRLNMGYSVSADVRFFAQLQDARLFGAERGTLANEQNVDLHQGYFDIDNVWLDGLRLRAGRQEIFFGDHRVLGNVSWTNVGRSFDGLRLTYSRGVGSLDLMWFRTRETDTSDVSVADVINFPGTPEALRKGTDDQDVYIAYGTITGVPSVQIEPYWIFLVDNGVGGSLLAPAAANQHRHTFGMRVDGVLFARHVDYTFEGAYQSGAIASVRDSGSVRDLAINAGRLGA